MDFEKLPKDIQEKIRALGQNSDLLGDMYISALENSKTVEEFQEWMAKDIRQVISECQEVLTEICDQKEEPVKVLVRMYGGCYDSVCANKPIDIIFDDPETEGIDEDELTKIDDEEHYVVHFNPDEIDIDPVPVANMFKQMMKKEAIE